MEIGLSLMTSELLPNYADTLKAKKRPQLDQSIDKLMANNPTKIYKNKEWAKIFCSLAHNLLAHMKLGDKN